MADDDRLSLRPAGWRPNHGRAARSGPGLVAAAASAAWLGLCGVLYLAGGTGEGDGAPRAILVASAILLPLGVIWIGAGAAVVARGMADEIARQRTAIEGLRIEVAAGRREPSTSAWAEMSVKLAELAESQQQTEWTLSRVLADARAMRETPPPPVARTSDPAPDPAQSDLGLETTAAPPPPALTVEDFIGALEFPADPDDRDGFRALSRALRDRQSAQLVTSAQDVLTLLSQDGIYMDDMPGDGADPALWRTFARGNRGSATGALGAACDEDVLDRVSSRMRRDTIFRDAAHHFLRLFDHTLGEIHDGLTDPQIAALMDTRSARAFTLLGRVMGSFR